MLWRSMVRGRLVALAFGAVFVCAAPGQAADKEPAVCPVTTVEITDALGPSEWKGTLTLDPSEGCTGVLTFIGTIDGKSVNFSSEGALKLSPTALMPHPFAARTHGAHTLEFYSVDPAGNRTVERLKISVVVDTADLFDCDDGLDNDGDGWIDFPDDPDCAKFEDESESG